MCRRVVTVDRAEVMRIAEEIVADLAGHEYELGALDPIESWRPYLSRPAGTEGAAGVAEAKASGGASVAGASPAHAAEAFPSSVAAVIAPTGRGAQLAVADMVWGFDAPWKAGPVFNARIETALGDPDGMWGDALRHRRCVVPAQAFFESHAAETVPSERTGRPVKRQYAFSGADGAPLLMAGLHERGRFSLVTTKPNGAVDPVHDRMPLVLSPAEAALWLAGRFEGLADRSAVLLQAAPER